MTAALAMLAGCGGGGGPVGTGGGTQRPDPPRINIEADRTTLPANPSGRPPSLTADTTVQLLVSVRTGNGSIVADGTVVNLTTSNPSVGTVSAPDDPDTNNVNEFTGLFANINSETSGGEAIFFFTSGEQTGTAVLTASTNDPASGRSVTVTITMTVIEAGPDERVMFEAQQTTLPVNSANVGPFIGSPFLSEVGIRFVDAEGVATNPVGDSFGVSIAPVSTASFSTLDDPETEEVNEFQVSLGQGPVNAVGGQATVFVNAGSQPGTATLRVTGTDPQTNQNFEAALEFTVSGGAADGLPASASLLVPAQPVFIQGVGSNTTLQVRAQVLDAGGQLVSAPGESNNVVIELTPPNPNNSRLQGVDAAGVSVSGDSIAIPSVNGLATFSFVSGATGGVHQLDVTADGADNNVDNGIQQPVTGVSSITVGNGRLAAIELVSPTENAITINRVSDTVLSDQDLEVDPDSGVVIPPDPDGTFSMPFTVVATDSFGAPVPPGTVINFGKLDTPVFNIGNQEFFVFSGGDGNPAEGGTFFRIPENQPEDFDGFLDAPGGPDEAVQNNDALVTFGKSVPGNDELESARFVDTAIDDFSLRVQQSFNNNDGSGSMVDDGPRIPYVIGRSNTGNITSQAATQNDGTASVTLTYPINAIGSPLVIWSQGTRLDGETLQTVADAIAASFPGIAPAVLSVSPSAIVGNSTRTVTLCLVDALNSPIQGAGIGFAVDGNFNASIVPSPLVTGPDGCVDAEVTTSGVSPDATDQQIDFTSGSALAELDILPQGLAFMTVSPTSLTLTTTSRSAVVSVFDGDGEPISGVQVTAQCESPVEITPSRVTDADGEAVFTLSLSEPVEGDDMGMVPTISRTCEFTATAGGRSLSAGLLVIIPGNEEEDFSP